jgi:hypothetical protein
MTQPTTRAVRFACLAVLGLAVTGCNPADPNLGLGQTPGAANRDAVSGASSGPIAIQPPANDPAATTASARIHIAPIIGSTVAAVTPLSRRLGSVAGANGLALVGEADPARTHIVKGYFSALAEGGQTTIVFVWDVFNPAGVRLHRIQGQEQAAGATGDPWASVPPATMERIADRLITDFKDWLTGGAAPAVAAPIVQPVPPVVAAPQPVAPSPQPVPGQIPVAPAPPPSLPPA